MIKEFVEAWEKNKDKLEEYLKTHKQEEYYSYKQLVKLLFDIVINPEIDKHEGLFELTALYDTGNILTIDDGDYQGTLIFVLHENRYQPSVDEYVYTNVGYGSCSGCDTLQAIHCYSVGETPDETQLKDYMTLCLHLLQRCKRMSDDE